MFSAVVGAVLVMAADKPIILDPADWGPKGAVTPETAKRVIQKYNGKPVIAFGAVVAVHPTEFVLMVFPSRQRKIAIQFVSTDARLADRSQHSFFWTIQGVATVTPKNTSNGLEIRIANPQILGSIEKKRYKASKLSRPTWACAWERHVRRTWARSARITSAAASGISIITASTSRPWLSSRPLASLSCLR
jgi:hypothetical protein